MTFINCLDRPADITVRRQGIALLQELDRHCRGLNDVEDQEALHGFRVALRRCVTFTHIWNDILGSAVPSSAHTQLAHLKQRAGAGRDAEVMLHWLNEQSDHLDALDAEGFIWLSKRLIKRTKDVNRETRKHLRKGGRALVRGTSPQLQRLSIDVSTTIERPTYRCELTKKLREQSDALLTLLGSVGDLEAPVNAVHDVRLICIRLRYLMEGVGIDLGPLKDAVRICTQLQKHLGVLNDISVLREELVACMFDIDGRKKATRLRTGLESVRVLNENRTRHLSEEFELLSLRDHMTQLQRLIHAVAHELEGQSPAIEIERKYLLSALPPRAKKAKKKKLRQGYLPGKKLIERVRAIEVGRHCTYMRTVKLGKGAQRIEVEEETSRDIFDALWALTEGCRIEKVRFYVPDGEFTWEVDMFSDRDLVLAEIELPTPHTPVHFPKWLAPYIIRDVTEDGEYTNWSLARSNTSEPS